MELSNEFGYTSKVTQDLLVLGTNDSEKFVETLA